MRLRFPSWLAGFLGALRDTVLPRPTLPPPPPFNPGASPPVPPVCEVCGVPFRMHHPADGHAWRPARIDAPPDSTHIPGDGI